MTKASLVTVSRTNGQVAFADNQKLDPQRRPPSSEYSPIEEVDSGGMGLDRDLEA